VQAELKKILGTGMTTGMAAGFQQSSDSEDFIGYIFEKQEVAAMRGAVYPGCAVVDFLNTRPIATPRTTAHVLNQRTFQRLCCRNLPNLSHKVEGPVDLRSSCVTCSHGAP
jgi:hypothetical protein